MSIRKDRLGMALDIGLDAAPRQEAGQDIHAEHHLRADRARTASAQGNDGRERRRTP